MKGKMHLGADSLFICPINNIIIFSEAKQLIDMELSQVFEVNLEPMTVGLVTSALDLW